MLVESGLSLALEKDKIKTTGGILTPATCQVSVLLRDVIMGILSLPSGRSFT